MKSNGFIEPLFQCVSGEERQMEKIPIFGLTRKPLTIAQVMGLQRKAVSVLWESTLL